MAFGNNRSGKQARAHFQLAGGSTIIFKHPYLAGQLSAADPTIDEIDVSACCKLDGRFFEASPNQDSAKQTVLVDGSVVTICNKLLNGTITMPVVRTTKIVSTGDFVSALQLIKSVGDTVGGLLYKTDHVNGKAITRLYYGVTVQRVPDDVSEGNDVPVYNVSLLYAGWIEAVSASTERNLKKIWSVGASNGLKGYFSPYLAQSGSTDESALTADGAGITDSIDDDTTSPEANKTSKASSMTANVSYNDAGTTSSPHIVQVSETVGKTTTTTTTTTTGGGD